MAESRTTRRQREPFVMVPRAMLYDRTSPAAVALWAVLDDLARHDPAAVASQAALAQVVAYTPRHLRRLVGELVDAGWLVTHRTGRLLAYQPLRRPRPQPVTRPGDNLLATPDLNVHPDTLDTGHECPQSGPGYLLRAHEEEEGRGRRPRWCRGCDETTRLLDRSDGTVIRCPACHPLAVPAF